MSVSTKYKGVYLQSVSLSDIRSVFSPIHTEYGELRSISLYSVQMRENTDHNNSEYGQFLRIALFDSNY